MPEPSPMIYGLEKINQLIDLCIDCELYDDLYDIIGLSTKAQSYINDLYKSEGKKSLEEFGFEKFEIPFEFPVVKIRITSSVISPKTIKVSQLFRAKKPPYSLNNKGGILLKSWSDLFWAKRIRAELLSHNKDTWSKRYEDLLTFLDSRIPVSKSEGSESENQIDFTLTKFNYLMEQSAVATREASHGYAERARDALKKLYEDINDPKRGPYDRWISWNKGVAYQHMVGRNQEAVLEFNWVIRKFWNQRSTENRKQIEDIIHQKNNQDYFNIVLEFLVNIVPAYLQRAAINLKLQLGYHALQTLSEDLDKLLLKIKKDNADKLLCRATIHLQQRIDLQRIEAILQLDLEDDEGAGAEKRLKKAHKSIFNKSWNHTVVTLPLNDEGSSQKAIKTQLVEHIVKWFEQKAERLLSILRNLQNKSKFEKGDCDKDTSEKIKQSFTYLEGLIKTFWHAEEGTSSYWDWVKGNNKDELIYFSRWAQLLKLGMETVDELRKLGKKFSALQFKQLALPEHGNASALLLKDTIDLYLFLSEQKKMNLPVIRNKRPKRRGYRTIELENLRSDDLPDFTNGLSVFYKKMRDVLCANENDLPNLRAVAERTLKKPSHGNPVGYLRKHHEDLLDALDEYEIEFGENQQIHALMRCNERFIWHRVNDKTDLKKGCTNCLGGEKDSSSPESFDGLLACQEEIPRDQEQLPFEKRNKFDLLCYDYEYIMKETEDHLTEHLERHSLHSPPKKTLRFIGLQRWNSLTPAQGKSVGGGYFIYRTDSVGEVDLGIAIDPGFDYVRNLFRMGFSLMDVDIVLISHAHPDHLWDFESMVQLLHELEGKKNKIFHQLNVVLTLGSYHRLSHIINNQELRRFINPLVIDIRKEIEPDFFNNLAFTTKETLQDQDLNLLNYCFSFYAKTKNEKVLGWQPVLPGHKTNGINSEIEIWPTRAYHEDYSERSDSFGFLIKVTKQDSSGTGDKQFCFGYTGDTKWVSDDLYNQGCLDAELNCCKEKCRGTQPRWKNVASQYADCDVLLMHLGSLINHKGKSAKKFKDYFNAIECEALIRSENHPYLMGMIRFLREIYKEPRKKKLILMGEFGEELRGGIRTDLVKRLQQGLTKEWQMVPVDVGLDILLHNYAESDQRSSEFEFLCALCEKSRPLSEIDYFRFGQDEAIFYICKTCIKATPADVRQTRLRKLYDIGRELQTLPKKYTDHA